MEEDMTYRVPEAAEILGLKPRTILKYLEEKPRQHFLHAYLPFGQRSQGWRIPEQDILAFATAEGEWLVRRVKATLAQRHEAMCRTG